MKVDLEIMPHVSQTSAWIGFRDQNPQQSRYQFTWIDGTSFDYTNWWIEYGYPRDDANRFCGFMYSIFQGNDVKKWGNFVCNQTGTAISCVCKQTPTSLYTRIGA